MTVEQWLGEDNQLGIDIWHKKYQHNGETFDAWLDRIAGGDEDVRQLIIEKKFLFGGRILSNRGVTDEKVTYSNCYVIAPPEDNIESIYDTAKKLARTYSYGGGCGVDISKLSPRGAKIGNQAKTTSGAVSFMDTFNQVTEQIGQNGRRGALMISISDRHPDLEEFIGVKQNTTKVTSANISVRISDDFMSAVEHDTDWKLSFTRPETGEVISKTVRAKDLFRKLCENNWNYAEPGMLFWDRISNYNLLNTNEEFEYAGTNPCAEEPLPAGGSCLLGSLNLDAFVKDGEFDFDDFMHAVYFAVYALNDVLDEGVEKHPLQEQRDSVTNWRQIGLGIMGLADMLIHCGIRYGSDEAIQLCHKIGHYMATSAIHASEMLAATKGAYPKFDVAVFDSQFYETHGSHHLPLHNSQLLTIAPTGTLSTMLGISGGIEPIFANSYTRTTKSLHGHDEKYKVYTPIVKEYIEAHNLIDESELPDYFVTSADLKIDERIAMQGIWQRHIDASISSTINLPNSATVEEVEQLYMKAWKAGLKGVTVYRAGCAREGILVKDTPKEEKKETPVYKGLARGEIVECSDQLIGRKRKLTTGCVDGDTEYFNGKEWKPIREYTEGDLVLQYNADGSASLVKPLNYIKRPSLGQYHIKTKYGLDMMVSPDHRNVVFGGAHKTAMQIMTTNEIIHNHNKTVCGFQKRFKKSFIYEGTGIDLTDDEIRLEIAIFADGCYYSPTSNKCLISIKKERKRERLIELLNKLHIDYSENFDNDNYYNIKFYPPLKNKEKEFPVEWYNCNHHQLQVIFNEVFLWDGYHSENNQYTTIIKSNADFIQFVCTSLGYAASIYTDSRSKYTDKCYRVDWSERIYRSIVHSTGNKLDIPFVMPKDGFDYCFSVPSTMLVLRRNNNIFITGNCGSLHVQAFFDPDDYTLREVFFSKGSSGGCNNYMIGLSRMISLCCRAGVDIYTLKDQLDSTGSCPSYAIRNATKHDCSKGSCCPMAIGNALVSMYEELLDENDIEKIITAPKTPVKEPAKIKPAKKKYSYCPECGEKVYFEGGCNICKACGWSKCS